MNEANSKRTEELLALAVGGELDDAGASELLALCEKDPMVARRLASLVRVERALSIAVSPEDDTAFVDEFRARLARESAGDGQVFASQVATRLRRPKVLRLFAAAASVVAALVIAGVLLLNPGGDDEIDTDTAAVARVVSSEASDWQNAWGGLPVGERVILDAGLVELHYLGGVSVVLEGPANFEVTGPNSGYLHSGKLVAEVNDETARGFTIDGPAGRLIDLGTKFAVAVERGGEMEIHVIEGAVDAIATGGRSRRVLESQALRLADGAATEMAVDVGKFVTRIPEYRGTPPRFVKWSFDEDGGAALDTGRGLVEGGAIAEARSFSGDGGGPLRVEGRFGKAAYFDGRDAFFESSFRGIGGGQPRTVAFWVRVPEDLGKLEGYGIINWGNLERGGGAWQISVNTTAADGPVGHLRIGTHFGHVVGTTDLRDGRWHHCAVVMYGDERRAPNTATHVLLYVDGALEPAARKSFHAIDTATDPAATAIDHGIWMGRNLGYRDRDSPSGKTFGKFFRGEIDEMIICDTALNARQIGRLMAENRMP